MQHTCPALAGPVLCMYQDKAALWDKGTGERREVGLVKPGP